MSYSMSSSAVPAIEMQLNALAALLDKASAHAAAKKIDPSVLLGMRLAPDMFPLSRQIQVVTDQARNLARLTGADPMKIDNSETTFEDLKARVVKSLDYVKSLDAKAIDAAADKDVTF